MNTYVIAFICFYYNDLKLYITKAKNPHYAVMSTVCQDFHDYGKSIPYTIKDIENYFDKNLDCLIKIKEIKKNSNEFNNR